MLGGPQRLGLGLERSASSVSFNWT